RGESAGVPSDAEWTKRVEAWRESGLSAAAFCSDKDFSASGLRYWMSRLRKEQRQSGVKEDPRIGRVVRALADSDSEIVIEVGHARVGVRKGFHRETLRGLLELLDRAEEAENDSTPSDEIVAPAQSRRKRAAARD